MRLDVFFSRYAHQRITSFEHALCKLRRVLCASFTKNNIAWKVFFPGKIWRIPFSNFLYTSHNIFSSISNVKRTTGRFEVLLAFRNTRQTRHGNLVHHAEEGSAFFKRNITFSWNYKHVGTAYLTWLKRVMLQGALPAMRQFLRTTGCIFFCGF